MFCDVRVCYRLMAVAVKARPAYLTREFVQWCLNMLKWIRIMTDTQAIDAVTFDFKGTRVHRFVSGYTDYQMDYF